jgi:uncharacterized protein involved in exopolysaccharide biosynthesis
MTFQTILRIIFAKRKNLLLYPALVFILLYILLSFMYPVSYSSEVSILPPDNSHQSSLGSLLAGQDLSSIITGVASNANSQLYMEELKSRSAGVYVVRKNNLVRFYKVKNELAAYSKLFSNLDMELTKEGIIKLHVVVTSTFLPDIFDNKYALKKMAADISNSYVEALDMINRRNMASKAKKAREYIESQLSITRACMDSAEAKLAAFQRTNKTIALPEQVKATIESASQLKTEIVKTEIDINMAQSNMSSDNKSLQALKEKLQSLKSEYNKMEMNNQDYLLAFNNVPEIGKQLAVLMREVKIQNEVYSMLQQQYYKEKIQENRDLPTVEVLDEAVPPFSSCAPRTFFSSAMGALTVFLLMMLGYILSEKNNIFEKIKELSKNV